VSLLISRTVDANFISTSDDYRAIDLSEKVPSRAPTPLACSNHSTKSPLSQEESHSRQADSLSMDSEHILNIAVSNWGFVKHLIPNTFKTTIPCTGWVPQFLQMPRVRDIEWNTAFLAKHPFLVSVTRDISSLLMQVTGDPAAEPCLRCQEGLGPYKGCIQLSTSAPKGLHAVTWACAACLYHGRQKDCSNKAQMEARFKRLFPGEDWDGAYKDILRHKGDHSIVKALQTRLSAAAPVAAAISPERASSAPSQSVPTPTVASRTSTSPTRRISMRRRPDRPLERSDPCDDDLQWTEQRENIDVDQDLEQQEMEDMGLESWEIGPGIQQSDQYPNESTRHPKHPYTLARRIFSANAAQVWPSPLLTCPRIEW
jgi:hypothetical protein